VTVGPPKPEWVSLWEKTAAQGDEFDKPISDSGQYYGYLSKADFDDKTGLWDVFFELAPLEWMDNVIFSPSVSIKSAPPPSPATCFHIRGVAETAILNALRLRTTDDLAEGSWYQMSLSKASRELFDNPEAVVGDLYDPDIDLESGGAG
jgi:hypothetical protein